MSLVTLIRDYVDVANSTEQLDGYTLSSLSSLAYQIITFLFTVAKDAFVYCFTFNWLRDLSYFCFTPPSLLSSLVLGNNVSEIENFLGVENQPLSHLLAFSDLNFSTGVGIVFLGFFNGCFSCMHLSAAHLVTIRRMLVQGVPAGLCSAFGTALGQFVFLACIIFGFRGLLLPWLAFEPLQFLLGTGIILSVASTMAQDRRTPTIQWSAKSSLFTYVCTSALLAWCEQAAIFQWMGNISFGAEPTFLESTPSLGVGESVNSALVPSFWGAFGTVQYLAQNTSYLLAFLLGSIVGASLIGVLLQRFLELILRYKKVAVYYGLIKQANLPLATLIFAFGFGSMPYYGFDYLVTKGFGFVPHETLFQQTLFSPINLVSKTSQAKDSSQSRLEDQLALLFTLEGEKTKSFAVDTTPFDDGQYLKSGQKRPQAFEDLNYRGEHLWTNRLSRVSNIREQANQTQSSFLGPVFSWMRSFLWGDGRVAIITNETSPRGTTLLAKQQQADGFSETHQSSSSLGKQPSLEAESNGFPQIANQNITNKDSYGFDSRSSSSLGRLGKASSGRKKELSSEMEQGDNYLKEFDRQFDKGFSNFYDTDPQSLIEVEDQWQEKRIKEKCYTNPIYKFLLNTEIDTFLARQPNSHWLTPQEEVLLLKRRQLLGNYYDTLALTSQVSTSDALEQLVPKSYANAIYNHQFKGTLKIARRLFSIKNEVSEGKGNSQEQLQISRFSRKSNLSTPPLAGNMSRIPEEEQTRIVKFDQPLFSKEKKNIREILFHEELNNDLEKKGAKKDQDQSSDNNIKIKDRLEKILDLEKGPNNVLLNKIQEKNIFSLEQAESTPLYAGWDDQLRKFILTNRYQNRALAGYTVSEYAQRPDSLRSAAIPSSGTNSTKNDWEKTTVFTTWPIPNPFTQNAKKISGSKILDQDTSLDGRVYSGDDILEGSPKEFSQKLDTLDSSEIGEKQNKFLKSTNNFLFQSKPVTNDMVNALLQWQKLMKENKELSKEDKQVTREKISFWPDNVRRAYWSNELLENDMEFDEPTENVFKKKAVLWEFTPPNHGGFVWSGKN